MSTHLTEEEQIEAIKRWWKENGTATLAAVVIVAGGWFGYSQYQSHQENKAASGSELFSEFQEASMAAEAEDATDEQKKTAQHLAEELIEAYDGSLYEDMARLHLAKIAVESKEFDNAKSQLQSVVDDATSAELGELAQLRLARVLIAQKEYDAALQTLSATVSPAFQSAYTELKGDVYMMQDKFDEARTAYEAAQTADTTGRNMLLQMKIENTKVASETPEIPDPELMPSPHANPHAMPAADAAGDA